jgi:hypothetical protein
MGFFTKKAPAAARQLTPATPPSTLSFSRMKEVMSVEPTVPVHHESFLSASLSDAELLNVYDEEFFIEGQATPEDELADHTSQECDAVVPHRHSDRIVLAGLVFSVQVPFVTHDAPAVPAPVYNPQQPCRPYPAAADIMFDNATPEDNAKELALCTIFNPSEFPALFMRPIKPAAPYTPSPQLLDTSDLRVQPVLATTSPLCDAVSQMLDFNLPIGQPQEIASVYVSKQGRSLMCPPPVCSDSDEEELDGDHLDGQARQRRDSIVDNGTRDWDVEYDRVLRRITGQPFLPALEHLCNVESRSAFITYDMDVQAPQATTAPASGSVPDTCLTGACTCLVHKGCTTDEAADTDVSEQSSLDLVDDIVNDYSFVVNNVVEISSVSSPAQDDAFNPKHAFPSFLDLSESHRSHRSQSPASDSDSDSSDEDVERPPSPPPLPLHYLDADTQQYIGFSAFNQYSVYVDDEEVAPRIHRDGDDYDDEDFDLVDGIVEIGDSPTLQNDGPAAVLSLVEATVFSDLKENTQMHVQWYASSLTVGSRHMRIRRKFGWTKYQRLTRLDSIKEASETFEDPPASVQPLQARRANFMDDEDSEDDVDAPSSDSSTNSFDSDSLYAMPVLTVVENLHEFFDAAIWHHQPSLQLTYPVGSQPQSADLFLDPDILDALEVEIIAYMLDCITAGRFNELTELASDLHWATRAIASDFPVLSLLERLGEVVELVAAQVVALGTN